MFNFLNENIISNSHIFIENYIILFPSELYILTCLLILIIFNSIYGNIYVTSEKLKLYTHKGSIPYAKYIHRESKPLNITSPMITLMRIILVIALFLIINSSEIELITYNHLFKNDYLTISIKKIILISTLVLITIFSSYLNKRIIHNNDIKNEYLIILGFSVIAIELLIDSYDLLSLYLSIELQSLSFYLLATIVKKNEYSIEAGFKYFILGVFSSGFLLLGFVLIYGLTGITNIEQFNKLFINITNYNDINLYLIIIAIILILSSLLFKLGAVPFHIWLPDVYEGSLIIVTAFFAIIPKIAILTIILRLFYVGFYELFNFYNIIIITCSVLSMIIASFSALVQIKLIRLLAYSAIGHIGYMLIGLSTGTIEGIQATLLYMIIYIIMNIGLFNILILLHIYDDKLNIIKDIKYIKDLTILKHHLGSKLLIMSLIIILFSMAGVPPLVGFFSKSYIFNAAINSSMYFIVIIGLVTSILSTVYYLYLIRVIFFDKKDNYNFDEITIASKYPNQLPISNILTIFLTLIFIVFFFIYPSPLISWVHKMSLLLIF